jgi:hypothetical protein
MVKALEYRGALAQRTKVESEGKIGYSESSQAWNVIKLKKDLFLEFPQLKEKRSRFSYKIIYCRNPKEFEDSVKELVKGNGVMPLMLWLYKD